MNEVPLTQAEGVTGTLELFAFPMLDDSGKPTRVVEYVRDISKRKRAEEAIKENAEKIKLLAYSVSHDLKNPTIGIYMLAKALQEKYSGILDEKGKKYCDLIQKTSEQLSTLVGQINFYKGLSTSLA
jgi:light-regulated signal transduction histidine kinase (bacteriophytochrome)